VHGIIILQEIGMIGNEERGREEMKERELGNF